MGKANQFYSKSNSIGVSFVSVVEVDNAATATPLGISGGSLLHFLVDFFLVQISGYNGLKSRSGTGRFNWFRQAAA